MNDIRMGTAAMKWVPVSWEDLDETVFAEIKKRTASLINNRETETREKAIRCLGLLQAREYTGAIKECLSHDVSSTRLAALLTLADFHSCESSELFIKFAEKGTEEEKYTAIEAIGRLKIKESVPLLRETVINGSNSLRKAAITALGEMGDRGGQIFKGTAGF